MPSMFIDTSEPGDHAKKISPEVTFAAPAWQEQIRAESKARQAQRLQQALRLKELQEKHIGLIKIVAHHAREKKNILPEQFRRLKEKKVLEQSTTFRGTTLFPGERLLLMYDFTTAEGVRLCGRLGFSHKGELIAIDEYLPQERQEYFGARLRRTS